MPLLIAVSLMSVAACGGDSSATPTSPSSSVTSVSVNMPSPIRMGQTAQVSGFEVLSDGQSRVITAGWLSNSPAVARVTSSGLVSGVANGRATIYVVAGGRQGQQVVRVVPDYQGQWNGGLRVTSCSQTGVFEEVDFCDDFPVGSTTGYQLTVQQSGESLTATADYGSGSVFPAVTAPVQEDGSSTFRPTLGITQGNVTLLIAATFAVNAPQVGTLTGTVAESWRVPNLPGEGQLVQDIVLTGRSGISGLSNRRRSLDWMQKPGRHNPASGHRAHP